MILGKLSPHLFEADISAQPVISTDGSPAGTLKLLVQMVRGFIPYLASLAQLANMIFSPFDAQTTGARNPRMRPAIFVIAVLIFLASLILLAGFVQEPVTGPQEYGMLAVALWAAASWIAFSSIFMV